MTDQQRIDAVFTAVKVLNDTLLEAPNDYLLRIASNISLITDAVKTNGKWNGRVPQVEVSFFKPISASEQSSPYKLIPAQKIPS